MLKEVRKLKLGTYFTYKGFTFVRGQYLSFSRRYACNYVRNDISCGYHPFDGSCLVEVL